MLTPVDDQAALVNEQIWRAWVQKGRLQEQAAARKSKIVGIVLVLLALGSAFYWMR
jgi:hypothetical protein